MQEFVLNILGGEWMIIIFVVLLLFLGSGQLPGAAKKLGKVVAEFKVTLRLRTRPPIAEHHQKIDHVNDFRTVLLYPVHEMVRRVAPAEEQGYEFPGLIPVEPLQAEDLQGHRSGYGLASMRSS